MISDKPDKSKVIHFRELAQKLKRARSTKELTKEEEEKIFKILHLGTHLAKRAVLNLLPWTERDQLNFLRSIKAIRSGITPHDRELAIYSILYTEIIFPISTAVYNTKFILDQFWNAFYRMGSYLEKAKTKDDMLSGLDVGYVWLAGRTKDLLVRLLFNGTHSYKEGVATWTNPLRTNFYLPSLLKAYPIRETISIREPLELFIEMTTLTTHIRHPVPKEDVVEWGRFYNKLINPGTGHLPTRKVLLNILKVFGPTMNQGTKRYIGDILDLMLK